VSTGVDLSDGHPIKNERRIKKEMLESVSYYD
jgi:hypothetical protein